LRRRGGKMPRGKLLICFIVFIAMNCDAHDVYYLFSHGLADSHKQAYKYAESTGKQPYIIKTPFITFDYPDVSSSIFRINRFKTSLAQDNEISCLAHHYFNETSQKQSVLVGVSRGASTIINFMGLYNPENVYALILESPFDAVESIVTRLAYETKFGCIPGAKKYGSNLLSFIFCQYKPEGIKPIDQVQKIKKDLPILIICSFEDKLVPVWSSINLYIALRESGHQNAYLLILPEGKHAKLITHTRFGYLYQHIVHAFYCKYDLPHDPYLAQLGMPLFTKLCQPDHQFLYQIYPDYALPKQLHLKNTTLLSSNGYIQTIKKYYDKRHKNH
jgi:prolyl oligopeptidase family protein